MYVTKAVQVAECCFQTTYRQQMQIVQYVEWVAPIVTPAKKIPTVVKEDIVVPGFTCSGCLHAELNLYQTIRSEEFEGRYIIGISKNTCWICNWI